VKTLTAKANAARNLHEKAGREARCGRHEMAAGLYMKAGKEFWAAHERDAAVSAWRRACEQCEREADRLFQEIERSSLN
jgi:hypothetical protein